MNPLTFVLVLARLIAGEAGVCDIDAKLAVAHVNANRIEAGIVGGWYGDAARWPGARSIHGQRINREGRTAGGLPLLWHRHRCRVC